MGFFDNVKRNLGISSESSATHSKQGVSSDPSRDLRSACIDGNVDNVLTSLERGADPNGVFDALTSTYSKKTPTRTVLNIAEILVERGADVNGISPSGYSPLALAIASADLPLVDFLLKKGADPNLTMVRSMFIDKPGIVHTPLSDCLAPFYTFMDDYRLRQRMSRSFGTKREEEMHSMLFGKTNEERELLRFREQAKERVAILELLLDAGADYNSPIYIEINRDNTATNSTTEVFDHALDFAVAIAERFPSLSEPAQILRSFGAMTAEDQEIALLSHVNDAALKTALDLLTMRLMRLGKELGQETLLSLKPGDTKQEKIDVTFLLASTSLLSNMACVDGFPSGEELNYFTQYLDILQLDAKSTDVLTSFFRAPVYLNATEDDLVKQFSAEVNMFCKVFGNDATLLYTMAELLLDMGFIDGLPGPQENKLLMVLVEEFQLEQTEYEYYQKQGKCSGFGDVSIEASYQKLKCSATDSDDQIKLQYRKLAKDYHPDVVQGTGLPEDFTRFANHRFQEIQEAYEKIKEHRAKYPITGGLKSTDNGNSASPSKDRHGEESTTSSNDLRENSPHALAAFGKADPDHGKPVTARESRVLRKVEALFDSAEQAEDKNDWASAVEKYVDILGLEPDNEDAEKLLARARKKIQAARTDPKANTGSVRKADASDSDVIFRCQHCPCRGRIARAKLPPNARNISIKCPRCGRQNSFDVYAGPS